MWWNLDPWLVGVALAVFSAVFTNLGINIQKLAHTYIKRDHAIAASFDHMDLNSPQSSIYEEHLLDGRVNIIRKRKPRAGGANPFQKFSQKISHFFGASHETGQDGSEAERTIPESDDSDVESLSSLDSEVLIRSASQFEDVHYQNHPIWQLGLGIMIFGSLADFSALALAPQSIVAPLGSLTLVFNIFFARWMHHERITPLGLLATSFIVMGSVLTVSFASHKDESINPDHLLDLYFTTRFIIYATLVGALITFTWITVSFWSSEADSGAQATHETWRHHYFKLMVSGLSGMIGAHSMLFAKFTAELIAQDIFILFTTLMGYTTLVGLGLTIFAQIKWLNEGIKRFDSIYVLPVAKAFWVFFSVVSGLITFAEYRELNTPEILMFCVGIGFVITGVGIFSQGKTSEPMSDSETVNLQEFAQ
jgi:hypothetical protein